MIDLEKCKDEFLKYTEKYDLNNDNLKRKQLHSLRVMQKSRIIAQSLKLSEEEIQIATLIGLLHDIGRFEQYTKYKNYRDDNSADHGDLGIKILFKENKIKDFINDDSSFEIIKKAIYNHNKYYIEQDLTDKEKLFCFIVRDSDKLDILYEAYKIFWKNNESVVEESTITKEVIDSFFNMKLVENKMKKTPIDYIIGMISFIYDFNFKESYKIIKEKDLINKIINRFDYKNIKTKEKMETIRNIANKYINEKIK